MSGIVSGSSPDWGVFPYQKTGWFYFYHNERHYLWDWSPFREIPVESVTMELRNADFSYIEAGTSTLYFLLANQLEKIYLETGFRKAASIRANETS